MFIQTKNLDYLARLEDEINPLELDWEYIWQKSLKKGFKKEGNGFRSISEGLAPEGGDSGEIGFDCSSEHRQYLCIR